MGFFAYPSPYVYEMDISNTCRPGSAQKMAEILPLTALSAERFDRPDVLKKRAAASRRLAEFQGVAASMSNQGLLIRALGLARSQRPFCHRNHRNDSRRTVPGGSLSAIAPADGLELHLMSAWT